ncbi:adult cuticle protein 1-like [Uranotaenia lowii]|uniref:adult cuticle protein 1-like n=1 Tax=Uranotaenia lowii TaxID=190385 RepID=UPI00247A80A4|nr:adult cuticle protein 1-like [Uranotaenia lowii]
MKCIAAVVMMALAVAAVEGTYYSPLAYSAPLAYSLPHTTVVQDNSYTRYLAPAPLAYAAAPAPWAYPAAATYIQPAQPILLAKKEARYLAANRGAVHDAPLPGHEISQQSLNLEPAPGTL